MLPCGLLLDLEAVLDRLDLGSEPPLCLDALMSGLFVFLAGTVGLKAGFVEGRSRTACRRTNLPRPADIVVPIIAEGSPCPELRGVLGMCLVLCLHLLLASVIRVIHSPVGAIVGQAIRLHDLLLALLLLHTGEPGQELGGTGTDGIGSGN